jgi:hypothetical protein
VASRENVKRPRWRQTGLLQEPQYLPIFVPFAYFVVHLLLSLSSNLQGPETFSDDIGCSIGVIFTCHFLLLLSSSIYPAPILHVQCDE